LKNSAYLVRSCDESDYLIIFLPLEILRGENCWFRAVRFVNERGLFAKE
jgi:hypothetical protein